MKAYVLVNLHPEALRNANTPEEAVEVARLIAERKKEKKPGSH